MRTHALERDMHHIRCMTTFFFIFPSFHCFRASIFLCILSASVSFVLVMLVSNHSLTFHFGSTLRCINHKQQRATKKWFCFSAEEDDGNDGNDGKVMHSNVDVIYTYRIKKEKIITMDHFFLASRERKMQRMKESCDNVAFDGYVPCAFLTMVPWHFHFSGLTVAKFNYKMYSYQRFIHAHMHRPSHPSFIRALFACYRNWFISNIFW